MSNCLVNQKSQNGSVLFMALVFLVLTALISVTAMNTGILSRKMAGNSQFKEDAMQITEGISDQVARRIQLLLTENTAPQLYDVICMKGSTLSGCTPEFKILEISNELTTAAVNGDVFYQARYVLEANDSSTVRSADTQYKGGQTTKYFELDSRFDGVSNGLSVASLSVGFKVWFPLNDASTGGGGDLTASGGTGTGLWTN